MELDHQLPQPARAGQEGIARFFTVLLQIVAVWNIVGLIFQRFAPDATDKISEFVWVTNIPGNPSVVWGVVIVLFASGFMRRQRAALWAFIAFFQVTTLFLAVMVLPVWNEIDDFAEASLDYYIFCASVCFAIVSIGLLVWARPAFPARLARGAWLRSLAVALVGLALGFVVAYMAAVLLHGVPYGVAATWASAAIVSGDPTSSPYNLAYPANTWTFVVVEAIVVLGIAGAISTFFRADARHIARQADSEVAARTSCSPRTSLTRLLTLPPGMTAV